MSGVTRVSDSKSEESGRLVWSSKNVSTSSLGTTIGVGIHLLALAVLEGRVKRANRTVPRRPAL